MYYTKNIASPVGKLILASNGTALVGLWLEGQKYFGSGLGEMVPKADIAVFEQTEDWLRRYFAGEQPGILELPLAPVGSDFREKVWASLCEIPYGQITTYGAIAEKVGVGSAQAVGGAVGHNPISIIIPCHRVLGSDGSLTGYAGGLEKKQWLLRHENAF